MTTGTAGFGGGACTGTTAACKPIIAAFPGEDSSDRGAVSTLAWAVVRQDVIRACIRPPFARMGPERGTEHAVDGSVHRQLIDRFDDIERIVAEAQLAVREALARHRRAGNPVAVWRSGRVEWIPPEEIPVDLLPGAIAKTGVSG